MTKMKEPKKEDYAWLPASRTGGWEGFMSTRQKGAYYKALAEYREEQLQNFARQVNNYYNGGSGTPEELIEKMDAVFKK